jgi:hypothetical protein
MVQLSIKADIQDVRNTLGDIAKDMPNIGKKIIRAGLVRARTKSKVSIRRNLNTGGIRTRPRGEKTIQDRFWISTKRRDVGTMGIGWEYAHILERGATINAKPGKYLQFMNAEGNWIRTKSVTIPAKNIFFPVVDAYFGGDEFDVTIDKVLTKELKRLGVS